jgi:hypothetical protein
MFPDYWDMYYGNLSWHSVNEASLREMEASLTSQQKAEKAEKALVEEVEKALALEANRMFKYAEEQKHLNSKGKGRERHIDKVDAPCKWLYCNEAAPKSLWTTNSKGERCAPLLKGLSGSQCWAHEYQDPKSKAWIKPHTCKRLHPNEDGWRDEWNTDRCFSPSAADNFFSSRMANVIPLRYTAAPSAAAPSRYYEERSAW